VSALYDDLPTEPSKDFINGWRAAKNYADLVVNDEDWDGQISMGMAATLDQVLSEGLWELVSRHHSLIPCCPHCGCPPDSRLGHDDTCARGCNDGLQD
jgi:hypothetical protein